MRAKRGGVNSPTRTTLLLNIGRLIREARIARGLNQQQAATLAGLATSTVSLAERHGAVSAETAARLAAVLDLDAGKLQP